MTASRQQESSPTNLFVDTVVTDPENVFLLSGSGGSPTLGPQTVVTDPDSIFAVPKIEVILTSFDPVTATSVTLSNFNLTATHSNNQSNSGVRSASFKAAGKWYFEVT